MATPLAHREALKLWEILIRRWQNSGLNKDASDGQAQPGYWYVRQWVQGMLPTKVHVPRWDLSPERVPYADSQPWNSKKNVSVSKTLLRNHFFPSKSLILWNTIPKGIRQEEERRYQVVESQKAFCKDLHKGLKISVSYNHPLSKAWVTS